MSAQPLSRLGRAAQGDHGRGDPVDLAEARTLAYRARREHKIIAVSTPKLKGSCRITARYEEGSRAAYHVANREKQNARSRAYSANKTIRPGTTRFFQTLSLGSQLTTQQQNAA